MERIEYECDSCDDTHESRFLTSLPVQALSREEVAALNAQPQFDGVAGLEYHPCDRHPDGEIATEQLLVEIDGVLHYFRLIGDVGWSLEIKEDLVDAEDHEQAIKRTAAKMLEQLPAAEGAHEHEHGH